MSWYHYSDYNIDNYNCYSTEYRLNICKYFEYYAHGANIANVN